MSRDSESNRIASVLPLSSSPASGVSGVELISVASSLGSLASYPVPRTFPVARVLEVVVEGYLLGDLESMATEIRPKQIGAVGYPMAMAVLSGSELLGAISKRVSEKRRIDHYWTTYMAKVKPEYGDLGEIATKLARHGIAHSYLSHPGVVVVRGRSDWHLTLRGVEVVLDCVELYRDFRQSYEDHAKPFILDNVKDSQTLLNNLTQHGPEKAQQLIRKLPSYWWASSEPADASPS